MKRQFGSFSLSLDSSGVAIARFSRPPVNAVSYSVYGDIANMVDDIASNDDVKVVVLTAPDDARAWCGGADLNDFVGIDSEGRKERYRYINEKLPGFYRLDRPVIAAINGHAVGIGVILAGLCDLRVAAEDALFSCPEVDYGLVGGGAGLFSMLKMPEAKIREMLLTGGRYTARELEPTGFFNYVVPRTEVMASAMRLAGTIAAKSIRAIRARKQAFIAAEGRNWFDTYLIAQEFSSQLVAHRDASEGVEAFLEHRKPNYER